MNTFRFNSILNPEKYGYVFEPNSTEHWDKCYRTSGLLSYHAHYFETYGDGSCQHTPLCPVSSLEMSLDWMLSLAQYLSDNPEAHGYELNGLFGHGLTNRETVQFLSEIKQPKETDPEVYYSVNERKVSKSESKRHDKRWFKLPSQPFSYYYDLDRFIALWEQGQEPRSFTVIERLGLYLATADALDRTVSYQQSDLLQKWTNEEILMAARVLREMILSLAAQASARRSIEIVIGNHLRNIEQAKQATATQAAA